MFLAEMILLRFHGTLLWSPKFAFHISDQIAKNLIGENNHLYSVYHYQSFLIRPIKLLVFFWTNVHVNAEYTAVSKECTLCLKFMLISKLIVFIKGWIYNMLTHSLIIDLNQWNAQICTTPVMHILKVLWCSWKFECHADHDYHSTWHNINYMYM